ncbi:hypothetical protein D3C72_2357700 [compost metagenome]
MPERQERASQARKPGTDENGGIAIAKDAAAGDVDGFRVLADGAKGQAEGGAVEHEGGKDSDEYRRIDDEVLPEKRFAQKW